jgi:anti-sigma factor RsiW
MNLDSQITDDEIHLFLDGELTKDQRSDLQARLAQEPERAAEVFAEAERMRSLKAAQLRRPAPRRSSVKAAERLERRLRQGQLLRGLRFPAAAAMIFAAGWSANSALTPEISDTVDANFVLAAREALRVAQLDAGSGKVAELSQEKIQRLVGAINISVPPLPSTWKVTDVQVQPWQGRQTLVVTATTQALGQVTLVAAPMDGEDAVPLTLATDGRIPTVYWQSGGTAYALMGPAPSDRLEREAKNMEVATRRNLGPKFRG